MGTGVHLRCHSEYSLGGGTLRLDGCGGRFKTVAELARERGIGALALTDDNSIFGAVKFARICAAEGIKPIIGCFARAADGEGAEFRITLLARDDAGYASLCQLLTQAQLREKRCGVIDARSLAGSDAQGLIALAGYESDAGQALRAGEPERARSLLAQWRERLGEDFCAELTLAGRRNEHAASAQLARMAAELQIPAAAAHPALFAEAGDFSAHEIRACIAARQLLSDRERSRTTTPEQHLLSAAELEELFGALPGATANAAEIARRCNFSFADHAGLKLPRVADAGADAAAVLREKAAAGLAQLGLAGKDAYAQRLEREIEVIGSQGFADYYLIVEDFVGYARKNGIPVGPGRGSGAGSLVAYALGITGIDPLAYGLLFERFLNPERISQPDFDIDFCMDRRDEVIGYVRDKYGAGSVAQIVTFGTLGAKAVVRDVGRVLGLPYSSCDALARMIPDELAITLASARSSVAELRGQLDGDKRLAELWSYASELEGLPRNVGTHAGGVLIAPRPLVEFCPLLSVGDGTAAGIVSQFDKDDLEAIGLVKFDILGLRTLTSIEHAAAMVRARGNADFSQASIPLNDAAAFELYCKEDTVGVFQCEASGMREIMKRMRPASLEDIAALISLYRPGPIEDGVPDLYLKRRSGEEEVPYPHPEAEPILAPTHGTLVFQEQVMLIAQQLANYTLGQADVLRRAMGKKDQATMDSERERFVAGSSGKLEPGVANDLFDSIAKFAGYAFNKSHAVGYAILSVQTAYLKAHHKEAFYAAMLTTSYSDVIAIAKFRDDAEAHGVKLLPPEVNSSKVLFEPSGPGEVRYGLAAIRGVGRAAAETVIAERSANGQFKSLADLCMRCPAAILSRNAMENLIFAGACDKLAADHESALPQAIRSRQQAELRGTMEVSAHSSAHADQDALFDVGAGMEGTRAQIDPWTQHAVLQKEFASLGVTLSDHFFNAAQWLLADHRLRPLAEADTPGESGTWAGSILSIRTPASLRKRGLAVYELDDAKDKIEVFVDSAIEPEVKLRAGDTVILQGKVRTSQRGQPRLHADRIENIEAWSQSRLRMITVRADPQDIGAVSRVFKAWKTPGSCKVRIVMPAGETRFEALLENRAPQCPSLAELREQLGYDRIKLSYRS